MSKWLVSTEWLEAHMSAPDVVIMDASSHLPTEGRDARAEFLEEHIPGAIFFDLEDLSDTASDLPHMLPPPEKFASRMRKMGVGDGNRVIVYDTKGLFSAARAWWMFRIFGHDDVAILDGGLKKWKAEGRSLDFDEPRPRQERHFSARFQSTMVSDKDDVRKASQDGNRQVVDARSAPRFAGEEIEPRAGLRSGHIPGSLNVHYARLLNPDGTLRNAEEIAGVFADSGVDPARPVTTTCGSGVTAAILALGLDIIGHKDVVLYDGSWTDWGSDESLPLESGPGR
ncbi:MAG: 3-mercaptopyruvate sulfurtransferase [Pseudomonadota bacterium]